MAQINQHLQWILIAGIAMGCHMTKTKHGTCENCAEDDRRIWVYVYESGAGLNSESCQVCRPLNETTECIGVYEWEFGDTDTRSEGPYECAQRACDADISEVEITSDYDPTSLFPQYDESAWTTSCEV